MPFTHRAKKSLGQNFLKSQSALKAIVDAGNPTGNDLVLEIGPGKGALTEKLVKRAGKVIAVEKDDNLYEFLKEKFSSEIKNSYLDLIHKDITLFDPEVLSFYKDLNYKIIANIPYNITGLLIQKFLTAQKQPEKMVLLVQKEVADRIVANDRKESILSLSVKAYGIPKKIIKVPAKSFSPAPKVDSAVLEISNISRDFFSDINEDFFFTVVRTGFAHKRKLLSKNLTDLGISHERILSIFEKLTIPKNTRPETVSIDQWKLITSALVE